MFLPRYTQCQLAHTSISATLFDFVSMCIGLALVDLRGGGADLCFLHAGSCEEPEGEFHLVICFNWLAVREVIIVSLCKDSRQ